ncbi:hypothetical protein IFO71_06025 [Pseudoxanthomonas sp. CAU 1598]|uniref:Uncharacterized protein n=1 Tax=Pseudomarimonas arenosa TaxID=2774145 RepID=A0AAW3ZGZ3_9GAMM|nr:hypothetical protein [Pseudomarimonas arenosa]
MGLLPAQCSQASADPGLRFLQAALAERGVAPTSWPAADYPGGVFNAALRSLQEGFDLVIALLPPGSLDRLPAERATAEHWTWAAREHGKLIIQQQQQQWTVKVESDPLSLIAAWCLAMVPLLDQLEGLPTAPRAGVELTLLGPGQRVPGRMGLVELGWLTLNQVAVRQLGTLLPAADWQNLPEKLGLIEMSEQGGRLLWQSARAME